MLETLFKIFLIYIIKNMKNLFLNVLRSLKKNKLAMIGLTFLVFLSTGIFISLNSTTSAVNNEYNRIGKNGNIHQFTVSELYESSTPKYSDTTAKYTDNDSQEQYTGLYNNDHLVMSSDHQLMPYIEYDSTNDKFKMWYTLDITTLPATSAVRNFYIQTMASAEEYKEYGKYIEPLVEFELQSTVTGYNELQTYISSTQKAYGKSSQAETALTKKDINEVLSPINNAAASIQKQLSEAGNQVTSLSSTGASPMQQYLSDPNGLGKDVKYRKFKSINIDNSADSIFYKGVLSNPTDTIDKMVLIDSNQIKQDNSVQWNNFDIRDANFGVLDFSDPEEWDLGKTIKYLPEVDSLDQHTPDIHFIKKIFLLAKCNYGTAQSSCPVWGYVNTLTSGHDLPKNVEEYQKYWSTNFDTIKAMIAKEVSETESVYVKDYRVTVQWQGTAPSTAYINNWTSFFAVAAPEYMEANNLHTMSQNMYVNEQTYKNYVQSNPSITDQKQRFIGWLNSLKYPDIESWFNSLQNKHAFKNQIIKPGGGTPYIIIGTGITPDFVYPIVSISRSTPNPQSECIFFANDSGYSRIYDGFRSNETENYLVGTFNHGVNATQTLNKINDVAKTTMIYPSGTNAAYMADDTSNTLNAAAFRVVFIPSFLDKINIVSTALTVFILIIGLIICAIVIHRYIVNSQSILGVLQANGISRSKIAASMIPFALIPTVIGGILGVLVGTFLQIPILGLFKNYWMLPTTVLGFSWIGLLIAIAAAFTIFLVVIWATTFWILRKRTVDLMKADSQDNPNFISKAAKASVAKFGIVAKYRMSVAFSSLWKLIVLTLMTTMALSSLVFACSIRGKFETSIAATTNSRYYDYAVKLQTPTISGGQYTPVSFYKDGNGVGVAGLSGYQSGGNDDRDMTYVQSLYFGTPTTSVLGELPGIEYSEDVMPEVTISGETEQLNYFLNHNYYAASMNLDYVLNGSVTSLDEYLAAFDIGKNQYNTNLFVPFANDATGQNHDIFYLKDRIITKDSVDYIVGLPLLGIASNPWDISSSLMPDNNRNLAIGSSEEFVNTIGKIVVEPTTEEEIELNEKIFNDQYIIDSGQDITKYFKFDSESRKFKIVSEEVVGKIGVSLKPAYLRLLSLCYSNFDLVKQNYYITYNTVPLLKEDETYTYLDANNTRDDSDVSIMGIKANPKYATKYIALKDDKNNDLLSKIRYTSEDLKANKAYPIIINTYASKKYNLGVGDTIKFTVNNRSDRYLHKIRVDNNIDDPVYNDKAKVTFKVVGVCTTYQGQEYFIDQDLANYILGLKSHLLDDNLEQQTINQPNNYYGYEKDTIGDLSASLFDGYYQVNGNDVGKETLINLKDYQNLVAKENYQLTAYGFNGVFTKNIDGKPANPILTKGLNLYSPSGIYCASDRIDSTVTQNMLRFGSNAKIACTLLFDNDTRIPLANRIISAYNEWQAAITEGEGYDEAHAKLEECVNDLQSVIGQYFGTTAYQLLLSGAIDKTSTSLVYNNLSNTITTITDVVLAFVIAMVVIIVALLTNMVINDSRRLAALLKTLGYTDSENIATYLSIYVPVIIFGLAFAALITWGLVSAYNAIILNGLQIWIGATIEWYYYLIGFAAVGAVFGASGAIGAISMKKAKVAQEIKQ